MEWKEIIKAVFDSLLRFIIRKKAGDAFTDQVKIIYGIREVVHKMKELNIERVVIAKAHNDGDDLMPISYKYVTVIYQDCREPFKQMEPEKFKGISVDAEYTLMISKMYQQKSVSIEVNEMENCMAKQILMDQGALHTNMYFLKHTKKAFWYISFSTSQPGEKFVSNRHNTEFLLLVSKIKKLVRYY